MEHQYQPITGGSRTRTGLNQDDTMTLMQDMVMEEILSNGRHGINDFADYRSSLSLRSGNEETTGLTSSMSGGVHQLPSVDEYRMNVGNYSRSTNNNSFSNVSVRGDSIRATGYSVPNKNSIVGASSTIAGFHAANEATRRQKRLRVLLQIIAVIGVCLCFLFIGLYIGKQQGQQVTPVAPTPATVTTTTELPDTTTTTNPGDTPSQPDTTTTTIADNITQSQPDTTTTTNELNEPSGDGDIAYDYDRLDKLISILKSEKYSTSPSDFESTYTPQSMAAYWLANEDPLQVSLDGDSVALRQRYALAVLYYQSNGTSWKNSFKFLSGVSECHWNDYWDNQKKEYTDKRPYVTAEEQYNVGVLCDDNSFVDILADETPAKSTVVKRLYLPSIQMVGAIPTEIALLTELVELNLYNNEFEGTIPEVFSTLVNLRALALHQNNLDGEFPSWIGQKLTNLEVINLGDNNIYGDIPSTIQSLNNLKAFNCESCLMQGSIEPLHGLSSIEKIHLGVNSLTGTLTMEFIESLPNLIELDLGGNKLEGNIPSNLMESRTIEIIDLHGNQLTGTIPDVDVNNTIKVLALHENKLTGTIDNIIANLSPKIQHLDLSSNQFTGNGVPTTIGLLTDLKYLFIAMNPSLSQSQIPTEIGRLTELIDVSFQSSNRIGQIPYHIEGLQLLTTFDLNNNYLTGSIPPELGSLPQLRFLLLRGNKLGGAIPSSLSRLTHLDTVLLDANMNLNSGTEHICAAQPAPRILQADCTTFDMDCACCTICCDQEVNGTSPACNEKVYFSNINPSAEYHYVRKFYQFNEEDIVFPVASVPKSELPLYIEDENGNQFAVDNPDWGGPITFGGLFEYAPYDYETNNADVANPFEEYIEDADLSNGDNATDIISDDEVYSEIQFGQEVDSFEDVYQSP